MAALVDTLSSNTRAPRTGSEREASASRDARSQTPFSVDGEGSSKTRERANAEPARPETARTENSANSRRKRSPADEAAQPDKPEGPSSAELLLAIQEDAAAAPVTAAPAATDLDDGAEAPAEADADASDGANVEAVASPVVLPSAFVPTLTSASETLAGSAAETGATGPAEVTVEAPQTNSAAAGTTDLADGDAATAPQAQAVAQASAATGPGAGSSEPQGGGVSSSASEQQAQAPNESGSDEAKVAPPKSEMASAATANAQQVLGALFGSGTGGPSVRALAAVAGQAAAGDAGSPDSGEATAAGETAAESVAPEQAARAIAPANADGASGKAGGETGGDASQSAASAVATAELAVDDGASIAPQPSIERPSPTGSQPIELTRPAAAAPVVQANLAAVPIEIALKAAAGIKTFEIRLDPAELGRIDVTLEFERGEVRAHVSVDRVETLALLQRDAKTIERAFEQLGLKTGDQGIDLSLRDQNAGREQGAPRDQAGGSFGENTRQNGRQQPSTDANAGRLPGQPPDAPIRTWRGFSGVDVRI